jgi:iron complex transport system ATP-binding protein
MIALDGATKRYGHTTVLDDVTVSFGDAGVTALIGPNGAGKSTLFGLVGRLIRPDAGTVTVDGRDVTKADSRELARTIAVLRQDNHVAARLTVEDLVEFGRFPHSGGRLTVDDRAHIERAIDDLDLQPYRHRFLDELSGGQRQRAFVAMALAQDTEYVLLDEPLNNLDPKHAVALMKLIADLADDRGLKIVVVMHDINIAAQFADTIIAMRDGRVLHHGPVEDVVTVPKLVELYETPVRVEQLNGRRVVLWD